ELVVTAARSGSGIPELRAALARLIKERGAGEVGKFCALLISPGSVKGAATMPPAARPPVAGKIRDDHFAARYRPRSVGSASAYAALRRGDRGREIRRPRHGRGGRSAKLCPRHRV